MIKCFFYLFIHFESTDKLDIISSKFGKYNVKKIYASFILSFINFSWILFVKYRA